MNKQRTNAPIPKPVHRGVVDCDRDVQYWHPRRDTAFHDKVDNVEPLHAQITKYAPTNAQSATFSEHCERQPCGSNGAATNSYEHDFPFEVHLRATQQHNETRQPPERVPEA